MSNQANAVIPAGFDPITFEVLSNSFTAAIDEMGVVLEKVAFSTVTSEAHDYSCAISNAVGDVVSRGVGDLPLIGGTISFRIKAVLATIPADDIKPGDVFIHNDPYLGGTHLQDVSIIVPVFWEGALIACVQTCSHWPDIGGPVPGSFNSQATSAYAEALIISPSHIVREGVWNVELERMILRNLRIPEIISGDLRGLVEAARAGEIQLLKLLQKYGKDTILKAMDGFMSYSEKLLRQEFAKLPDGTVSFVDYIDRDPCSDNNDPIPVGLDITISGDRATLDYSRSGKQALGPVNCTIAATSSTSVAVLKAIFPHIPLNDGFIRAFDLVVPDDCVINAKYPAPVSGHAANSAEKIVSVMHGCFMQLTPDRAMCAPTNLTNLSIFGKDTRRGRNEDYVMYLWLAGGWGGRRTAGDGSTYMMPLAAGTRLLFAEMLERVFPILVEGYGMMQDSEGAGKHRGGFGLHWPFRVTHNAFSINTQGDRELQDNWGFDGGKPAIGNRLIYAPGTDREESVSLMRSGFIGEPGVLIDFWQGGGGGWGNPFERDTAKVLDDVRAGLVSLGRAREVYGVEIDLIDADSLDYVINETATDRLRSLAIAAE
jgi:N-methylhydantoinase B